MRVNPSLMYGAAKPASRASSVGKKAQAESLPLATLAECVNMAEGVIAEICCHT